MNVPARAGSACTGNADCTACQNCHGCQHCARQHGTCGVKERLGITAEQRGNAPFLGSWIVTSSDGPGREETLQADGSALTADEGVGRWTVANGHLFVRFDDPAPEQQAYAVSTDGKGGVLYGQDQTGHALTLQPRTAQPVSTAPEPLATIPANTVTSLSAPPEPTPTAIPAAVQPAVPLSTCVTAIPWSPVVPTGASRSMWTTSCRWRTLGTWTTSWRTWSCSHVLSIVARGPRSGIGSSTKDAVFLPT